MSEEAKIYRSMCGILFVVLLFIAGLAWSYTAIYGPAKQPHRAYYDIHDPMCHSSQGALIVWIDSDNWIEVTGTDQEEIAELVAKRIGRKDKP